MSSSMNIFAVFFRVSFSVDLTQDPVPEVQSGMVRIKALRQGDEEIQG